MSDQKNVLQKDLLSSSNDEFDMVDISSIEEAIGTFDNNIPNTYQDINILINEKEGNITSESLKTENEVIKNILNDDSLIKRPSWGPTKTNGLKFTDAYKLILKSETNLNYIRFLNPDGGGNNLNNYSREEFLAAIGVNKDNFKKIKEQSKGYITVLVGNNSHDHAITLLVNLNNVENFEDLKNNNNKCYYRIDTKRFAEKTSFRDDDENSRPKNLLKNRILPTQGFNECALQSAAFIVGFSEALKNNNNVGIILNDTKKIKNIIKEGRKIFESKNLLENKGICK